MSGSVLKIGNFIEFDPNHTYMIAPGIPVLKRDFRQSVNNPEELIDLARNFERPFISEMANIAKALGMSVVNPGIKSLERLIQKASMEKGGNVDLVYDPLRCALVGSTHTQIRRALDFFGPQKNSRVAEFWNEFATPNPESGQRRGKIVYEVAEGIYAEVQIWSNKMMGAFDESHKPFEKRRTLASQLMETTAPVSQRVWSAISSRISYYDNQRHSIHTNAAKDAGLNKLLETFNFVTINGMPIAAVTKHGESYPNLIRPDLETATYVQDNGVYEEYTAGRFFSTTRKQFLIASQGMVYRHLQSNSPQHDSLTQISYG